MTLYIDTTNREELIVQLKDGAGIAHERRSGKSYNHAQHLLPEIDELLNEAGITLSDLKNIEVNVGPGSFTGTRVGVSVANALGFALSLPVNGQSAGSVQPEYGREPNISKPKKL